MDYTIVDDSWQVMGLEGTGSKDIIVKDAFIPAYRAIDAAKVMDGRCLGRGRPNAAAVPTAMVDGVSECDFGVDDRYHRGRTRISARLPARRVTVMGGRALDDVYSNAAIGEAASEIRSARAQLLYNAREMYDLVERGEEIPFTMRVESRRDQVRVAWRAVAAADAIFARCGGNAIRVDNPLQRFWRSAHAGLQHAIFVSGNVYNSYVGCAVGQPPEGPNAMTF